MTTSRHDRWAIIFLLLLPLVFMWKTVVLRQVPFPGDLLVGAYWPWHQNMPIKNPLISDVFSQIYSWKYLIAQSYKRMEWPLWNPHTLSGYPLLANFHSGALYPLNAVLLGDFIQGWKVLLYMQLAGCGLAMYALLRVFRYRVSASLIGATTYAFSGFAIVMWQLVHAGHAMIWIPLTLACIELAFSRKNNRWLWLVPFTTFMTVTAGYFQGIAYSLVISALFIAYRGRSWANYLKGAIVIAVGLMMSAIQILPTVEMAKYTVRFSENYLQEVNNGLLPIRHLATLFAPDIFGNPTTYNYWGHFNYQETVLYVGVLGTLVIVASVWQKKLLTGIEKFFLLVSLGALMFAFDTLVGRLIYSLKIPGLWTSSAGRVAMLLSISAPILIAGFVQRLSRVDIKLVVKMIFSLGIIVVSGLATSDLQPHFQNIFRNLVVPSGVLILLVISFWATKKYKYGWLLIMAVVSLDLFRFGWKYNPFVDSKLVFPLHPALSFLSSQPGTFRVDRENGPVLPSNTWEMYGLMSASGYDPMSLKDYGVAYQHHLNFNPNNVSTRYSELSHFDANSLADYGVKYLIARTEKIPVILTPDKLKSEWTIPWQDERITILENRLSKGIVYFENSLNGQATVIKMSAEKIEIEAQASRPSSLILATSYYPGWKAKVNGLPAGIERTGHDFQSILLPVGMSEVVFSYVPAVFKYGQHLSLLALGITGLGLSRRNW